MSQSDLHRQTSLRRSNVDNGVVLFPVEFCREGLRYRQGSSRHSLHKRFQRSLIGIHRRIMASCSCAALRFARLQRWREQAPVGKYVSAEVLQLSTDIRGLPAIEIKVSFRRIGVETGFITSKHAERDEGIEEVASPAQMDTRPPAQGFQIG